eukprot:1207237-Pleurochrysis_carterae.AAC.2
MLLANVTPHHAFRLTWSAVKGKYSDSIAIPIGHRYKTYSIRANTAKYGGHGAQMGYGSH